MSIVIPTYNSLGTLPESLYAAFAQTFESLEVVVVDDGSSDGTEEYLHKLDAPLPLRVIRQQNSGAGAARTTGLRNAKGEYVLYVDSDVVMQPTMVEALVEALDGHPEVAFAYCDFETRAEHGTWRPRFTRGRPFDVDALRLGNYIAAVSLVRRELCPAWDSTLKALEDWDLWLTMADRGHVGIHVPRVLFETIDRAESITQTWDRNHHYESRSAVVSKHQGVALVTVAGMGVTSHDLAIPVNSGAARPPVLDILTSAPGAADVLLQAVGEMQGERPIVTPTVEVPAILQGYAERLSFVLIRSIPSPESIPLDLARMVRVATFARGFAIVSASDSVDGAAGLACVGDEHVARVAAPGHAMLVPAPLLAGRGWRVPLSSADGSSLVDFGAQNGVVNLGFHVSRAPAVSGGERR